MKNLALSTLATLGLALLVSGCEDDEIFGPDPNRIFTQVERLGNPLVSEVLLAKREHGHHNTDIPSEDVASFRDQLQEFVRNVAGRNPTVQTTISTVLLPDMLIVQTDRPANTSGWLTWAVASGYGGRNLTDDVVDVGLQAIFGPLLDPNNVTPGLTSDNVDANDKAFSNTFPYLAEPTR